MAERKKREREKKKKKKREWMNEWIGRRDQYRLI